MGIANYTSLSELMNERLKDGREVSISDLVREALMKKFILASEGEMADKSDLENGFIELFNAQYRAGAIKPDPADEAPPPSCGDSALGVPPEKRQQSSHESAFPGDIGGISRMGQGGRTAYPAFAPRSLLGHMSGLWGRIWSQRSWCCQQVRFCVLLIWVRLRAAVTIL